MLSATVSDANHIISDSFQKSKAFLAENIDFYMAFYSKLQKTAACESADGSFHFV